MSNSTVKEFLNSPSGTFYSQMESFLIDSLHWPIDEFKFLTVDHIMSPFTSSRKDGDFTGVQLRQYKLQLTALLTKLQSRGKPTSESPQGHQVESLDSLTPLVDKLSLKCTNGVLDCSGIISSNIYLNPDNGFDYTGFSRYAPTVCYTLGLWEQFKLANNPFESIQVVTLDLSSNGLGSIDVNDILRFVKATKCAVIRLKGNEIDFRSSYYTANPAIKGLHDLLDLPHVRFVDIRENKNFSDCLMGNPPGFYPKLHKLIFLHYNYFYPERPYSVGNVKESGNIPLTKTLEIYTEDFRSRIFGAHKAYFSKGDNPIFRTVESIPTVPVLKDLETAMAEDLKIE